MVSRRQAVVEGEEALAFLRRRIQMKTPITVPTTASVTQMLMAAVAAGDNPVLADIGIDVALVAGAAFHGELAFAVVGVAVT